MYGSLVSRKHWEIALPFVISSVVCALLGVQNTYLVHPSNTCSLQYLYFGKPEQRCGSGFECITYTPRCFLVRRQTMRSRCRRTWIVEYPMPKLLEVSVMSEGLMCLILTLIWMLALVPEAVCS
jgi:hypothetical protein